MNSVVNLKTILWYRAACGAGLLVALHVVLFAVNAGFASTNLLNPFSWIYNFIVTAFSPTYWLYWSPSAVATCLVGCAVVNNVVASPTLVISRMDVISSYFTHRITFQLWAYTLLTVAVPVSYIHVSGQGFVQPCNGHSQLNCLNNHVAFMGSGATLCGIVTIFTALNITRSHVQPLLINVIISDYIRPTLFKAVKESAVSCLKVLLIYTPIFYVGCYYFNIPYSILFRAFTDSHESFFTFGTLIGCWVLSTITSASVLMAKEVIELYLTQHIEFTVDQLIAQLNCQLSAFEEKLVFKDLSQLAYGRSVLSASDVFALSQPGGLPHNWNIILKNCYRIIYNFQNHLTEIQASNVPIQTVDSGRQGMKSPETRSYGLRRLRAEDAPPLPMPRQESCFDLLEPISSRILSFIGKTNDITTRPVKFFTAPQQHLQICSILENSHTVILAATALSGLCCRALKEDKFGVMVNDLPNIINTLVTLEESVSRIVLPKRKLKSNVAQIMHSSLPVTLKRCITHIAHTYCTHLEFLRLEPYRLAMLKRIVENGQEKEPIISNKSIGRPF